MLGLTQSEQGKALVPFAPLASFGEYGYLGP